ncbi:hypothetical protein H1164_01800 [Thermoactinomyces daqus]|uniref:Uncharacterized protein n=1 Tax=Thermoactinomyces daqus TaxID=1329516 RepID=A0A7W1X7T9_9BACL|nr:hypothetical protein [Thermoactinomyces daqus]MBA4541640.1 hypothetical protein [Thermoactinomyces daqus]
MPFLIKLNNISSSGQLNMAPVNLLLNQESFQKNNISSNNLGDLVLSLMNGPIFDQDFMDTPISQIKIV